MNSSVKVKNKKLPLFFNYESFLEADDQIEYIYDLLLVTLHRRKQESGVLCLNELNDIFIELKIPLRIRQLHQVFLFSTFDRNQSKQNNKQKILALMNGETKKVDMKAAAKWIGENIKKGSIKLQRMRATSHVDTKVIDENKVNKNWKLPPIRGTSNEKLTEQLKYLIEIFEEMEKERQNSGLIPINLQSDDQELDLSAANIPYDPELYELNKNLAKLRFKAEDRLARIIELARDQPRIRVKLEQAIQKFQRVRIEANQKVGRMGSMKAQKRLIQNRRKEKQKYQNLKLGEEEDLLRAARLHSLLSIQERRPSKMIL